MLWSDTSDSPPPRDRVTNLVTASCARVGEIHLDFECTSGDTLALVATGQRDAWCLTEPSAADTPRQPEAVPVRIVEPFRAWRLRRQQGPTDHDDGDCMRVALAVAEADERYGIWIRDLGERDWAFVPLPKPGYAWTSFDFVERVLVTPLAVATDLVLLPIYVPLGILVRSGFGH